MTHPTDDGLKPCPFCGSQPEPAPYVLKCVNAYCEAQPSVSGGNDDECATAWNKRALLVEQARTQTPVGYVALDYYSPGNHLFMSFHATRNTEHDWKPVYLNAGQS